MLQIYPVHTYRQPYASWVCACLALLTTCICNPKFSSFWNCLLLCYLGKNTLFHVTAESLGPFTAVSEDTWEVLTSPCYLQSPFLDPFLELFSNHPVYFPILWGLSLLPRLLVWPCSLYTAQLQGMLFIPTQMWRTSSRVDKHGTPSDPCLITRVMDQSLWYPNSPNTKLVCAKTEQENLKLVVRCHFTGWFLVSVIWWYVSNQSRFSSSHLYTPILLKTISLLGQNPLFLQHPEEAINQLTM